MAWSLKQTTRNHLSFAYILLKSVNEFAHHTAMPPHFYNIIRTSSIQPTTTKKPKRLFAILYCVILYHHQHHGSSYAYNNSYSERRLL